MSVRSQYATTDPLKVRIATHRDHEERRVDLDAECGRLMELVGDEAVLDVGCGPGAFLGWIRRQGHRGRLVAFDQSAAMLGEARASALSVEGSAERLPFVSRCFERVAARHMLYHVEDIPAAVQELARVVRRDGVVVVSTNSASSLRLILELRRDALRAHGFGGEHAKVEDRFGMENGQGVLLHGFAVVEERAIENALVFRDAEPIVRYCVTMLPTYDVPAESALWFEVVRWLRREASRRLVAMGGVWRDPKTVALYRCSAPR